jgi:hypothetical protein
MAVIKSLAAGAVTSLVIANLVHEDGGTGAQMLGSTEVTVLDHRVACPGRCSRSRRWPSGCSSRR